MNRESEEQRPVPQTFCGALQKEPNCKCLVLSVLIYGCLAAVTWCRCANVAKIVINFSKNPIKSTKHVSPCDDGYIYIPVAFMGMLYLVYLVECYHSPIRIDLLHGESQESVLSKLMQFKLAQPTIWWKAISYHYVRRKRQITRYRNGDNYTTTQVYYERVNTHAATSFYYYDYAGVKDISKDLVLDPKIPITKINLTKGFAFSNIRSATEFEEARSRFFAEQELRDDYMEMREGLDLGYNVNPATLVAVLGNPWFTNSYVYWCLSALLLSWPLRVIIEYNTQYADYQVTKLFGVNYDTPSSGDPIHASTSQLNQPGSYMLAPSYSEALLMEPAEPNRNATRNATDQQRELDTEMVPSYSEALLYQRAEGILPYDEVIATRNTEESTGCKCPCSHNCGTMSENFLAEADDNPSCEAPYRCSAEIANENPENTVSTDRDSARVLSCRGHKCGASNSSGSRTECSCQHDCTMVSRDVDTTARIESSEENAKTNHQAIVENSSLLRSLSRDKAWKVVCANCASSTSMPVINSGQNRLSGSFEISGATASGQSGERWNIPREISEPNLRLRAEMMNANTQFLRANGKSLENILENEEEPLDSRIGSVQRPSGLPLENLAGSSHQNDPPCRGAIPKKVELRARVTVNPMPDEGCGQLTSSKTYFCLKSILKQNSRRYTLVTTQELENFGNYERTDINDVFNNPEDARLAISTENERHNCSNHGAKCRVYSRSRESLDSLLTCRRKHSWRKSADGREYKARSLDQKQDSYRTLIFASPIQEVCPDDPFGGRHVVPSSRDYRNCEEISNVPVLTRLRRSFTERESPYRRSRDYRKHHRTYSIEPEYLFPSTSPAARRSNRSYRNGISFPPYEGFVANDSRTIPRSHSRASMGAHCFGPDTAMSYDDRFSSSNAGSFFDRRSSSRFPEAGPLPLPCDVDPDDTRSSSAKRTNLNMETSL